MNSQLFWISYVTIWILTVVMFVAVFLLYRHFGRQLADQLQQREAGGPNLEEQLNLSLETIDGKTKALTTEGEPGRPHILVFTAAHCGPCHKAQPILREGAAAHGDVGVIIIQSSDAAGVGEYVEDMPSNVSGVADEKSELFRLWKVPVTPFFVVTDRGGVVRKKGRGASSKEISGLFTVAEEYGKTAAAIR